MLTAEWNLDDAKQVWFEDGFEESMEKGEQKILNLLKTGKSPEEILKVFESRKPVLDTIRE